MGRNIILLVLLAVGVGVALPAWGEDKPLLGASDFVPTAEKPVGWRGDWTGLYPGAKGPTDWGRTIVSDLRELRCQASKPKEGQEGGGTAISEVNGAFYVPNWLTLGIFEGGFDKALIPDEAGQAPTEGDKVDTRTWAVLTGSSLATFYNVRKEGVVAYLAANVYSPKERTVRLNLGGNCGAVGWLNGEMFKRWYEDPHARTLKKGWNRIVVKSIYHDNWSFGLGIQSTDAVKYEEHGIAWATPMPDYSNSTPVIVGEKLFTTAEPNDLICMDKNTGKVLWVRSSPVWYAVQGKTEPAGLAEAVAKDKAAAEQLEGLNEEYVKDAKHNESRKKLARQLTDDITRAAGELKVHLGWGGGNSAPTPCSDGKFIYAWYGETGVLACFDLEGKRQWCVFAHPGAGSEHGINGSPALIGERIIIEGGANVLLCFAKKTGKLEWRADTQIKYGYASPVPARIGGVDVAVVSDGSIVRADDHTVLAGNLGPWMYENIQSPVVIGNDGYFLEGRKGFMRVTLPGDVKDKPVIAATASIKAIEPVMQLCADASPAVYEGIYYIVRGGFYGPSGVHALYAIDTKTGEVLYRQRIDNLHGACYYGPNGGGIEASPAIAGGKLYVLDNQGNVLIVQPGRTYKEIACNPLLNLENGGQECFQGSPVFDGDRMYLRGFRNMYCIGGGQ